MFVYEFEFLEELMFSFFRMVFDGTNNILCMHILNKNRNLKKNKNPLLNTIVYASSSISDSILFEEQHIFEIARKNSILFFQLFWNICDLCFHIIKFYCVSSSLFTKGPWFKIWNSQSKLWNTLTTLKIFWTNAQIYPLCKLFFSYISFLSS